MRSRYLRLISAAPVTALLAVTVAASGPSSAEGPAVRAITGRADGALSTVLIEASEPVAYLTSQPDPLTVFVDLRNARTEGVPATLAVSEPPVTGVRLEPAVAPDGAPVARVRVALDRPANHRVRASRNLIYVEVDRAAKSVAALARPTAPVLLRQPAAQAMAQATSGEVAPSQPSQIATRLTAVRPMALSNGTAIALTGNGRLVASRVEEVAELPARVLLDFENVGVGSIPASTAVNQGDVQRVRVAVNRQEPLLTRVVIDLARKMPYTVQTIGEELRVLFTRAAEAAAVAVTPAAPVREETPVTTNTESAPVVRAPEPTPAPAAAAAPEAPAPTASAPIAPAPAAPAPSSQAAPTGTAAAQTVAALSNQPAPAQAAQPAAPRFSGHPVTFDFQSADLRAVLRTFADISGLNIVIDPTIQGTVDVSLKEVPWDQALDIILKANKLGYTVDGTVVRIAPLSVLADEEAQRRKLAEAQALSGELRVLTRALSYAKAADLVPIVTKSALSQRGEVNVDQRTNTLIIRDLADRLTAANDLIASLDLPQPQVEIEARIVQTSRDFARALGVQWGINGQMSPALGNTTNLAFPNSIGVNGRIGDTQGPLNADTGVNLRAPGATSALGLALGSINGAVNLDVALTALERTGKGRLLSTPRVSTLNNVEAEMTQGVQIPLQTIANNTVTVTFKDAALTLKVTPQITAAGTVIMKVSLENATPDFSRASGPAAIPPINTQRALTTL
ncbi:MAG TPA: type IV pilus secretin PilQ, partial [Vicinamibacterales bacterium]|nr:type IV pilus secretin PilQ [Vicinamibacterales bacterium]